MIILQKVILYTPDIQNVLNMKNMQNVQSMQNMQNVLNMQNMQSVQPNQMPIKLNTNSADQVD